LPQAFGVADSRVAAGRIQQHHDQVAARQLGLHHHAAAGCRDVAGLLQADLPLGVAHQPVGVAKLHGLGPTGITASSEVESWRMMGCSKEALTRRARSCALDWLLLDKPVGST
jgi:hypothetical protein